MFRTELSDYDDSEWESDSDGGDRELDEDYVGEEDMEFSDDAMHEEAGEDAEDEEGEDVEPIVDYDLRE